LSSIATVFPWYLSQLGFLLASPAIVVFAPRLTYTFPFYLSFLPFLARVVFSSRKKQLLLGKVKRKGKKKRLKGKTILAGTVVSVATDAA
jgi:hypothetical protein